MTRPPPVPTLFPYTTLFRSLQRQQAPQHQHVRLPPQPLAQHHDAAAELVALGGPQEEFRQRPAGILRSEEHTSELQSRQYLVCRLLLEKKNHHPTKTNSMPP